ncbi:MAG: hypothetical protein IKP27_02785 [Paludibacteraceae bacterium]|nr:hypothetical protein [Paludibacteraceae bacterium]
MKKCFFITTSIRILLILMEVVLKHFGVGHEDTRNFWAAVFILWLIAHSLWMLILVGILRLFSVPEQWKKRVFFIFDVIVPPLLVLVLALVLYLMDALGK